MAISPLSVEEGKLTKVVNLSRAMAGQIQKYDRLRMLWNGRIELVSG
ncbi:MAG: hypothetical protein OES18_11885 [Deltaproteobacteria bacterium]|nr:hypothetical protein [Deltaproteobacteria bacterium]